MIISIFRKVDLSHFDRRKLDFIEPLSARQLWRQGEPLQSSDQRTPAGQCEYGAASVDDRGAISRMADTPGGKFSRGVWGRQRIQSPSLGLFVLSAV
jgi:hypothetical protein